MYNKVTSEQPVAEVNDEHYYMGKIYHREGFSPGSGYYIFGRCDMETYTLISLQNGNRFTDPKPLDELLKIIEEKKLVEITTTVTIHPGLND